MNLAVARVDSSHCSYRNLAAEAITGIALIWIVHQPERV